MKKALFSVFISVLLISLLALPVLADGGDRPTEQLPLPTGADQIPDSQLYPNLVDDAGLLTQEQADELLACLDELSEKHDCTVSAVTTSSFNGMEPQDFADAFFDYYGYGHRPDRDGMMIVVCIEERQCSITTHMRGTDALAFGGYDELVSIVKPSLAEGDCYTAFRDFADYCDKLLTADELAVEFQQENAGEEYLSVDELTGFLAGKGQSGLYSLVEDNLWERGLREPYVRPPFSWWPTTGICLAVGIIAAFIVVSILKGQLKSVRRSSAAAEYVRSGSLVLTGQRDDFINSTVTRTARPQDDGNDSGGGGTHTSSSGSSHGGGSFSF